MSASKTIRYSGAIYRLAEEVKQREHPIEFTRNEVGFLIQLEGGKLKELLRKVVVGNQPLNDDEVATIIGTLNKVKNNVEANPAFIHRTEKVLVDSIRDGFIALLAGDAFQYPTSGGGADMLVPIKPKAAVKRTIKYQGQVYRLADDTPEQERGTDAAVYKQRKGAKRFTAKDLLESFRDLDEAKAKELADAAKRVTRQNASTFLHDANIAIDGHGVDVLRAQKDNSGGSDSPTAAAYINTGDSYSGTLLFDYEEGTLYLTSVGDWQTAWEAERKHKNMQLIF